MPKDKVDGIRLFCNSKTYLADVSFADNFKTFYASHGLVRMHSPKEVILSANGIFRMRTVCTYPSIIKPLVYKLSLNPHPNNMTLMRHFLSI